MDAIGVLLFLGLLALLCIVPYYILYSLIKKGVEAGNKELIEENARNTSIIVRELQITRDVIIRCSQNNAGSDNNM